jgi:plastocyanin
MLRRTYRSLAAIALAAALAGCAGSQVSTVIGTVSDGPTITALNVAFDRSELTVPAGEATGLLFDNRDSVPHNVAIYADDTATQPLFVGQVFSGPGSMRYELPALAPGRYLFRCDVHQEMRGSIVATP